MWHHLRAARERKAFSRFRPWIETLEERALMSTTTTIAEEQWPGNNTPSTAYPLGLNWGGPNINEGATLLPGDADYFQFSTIRPPETGDSVVLSVLTAGSFPLVLHISYWNGTQFVDASNDPGRFTFGANVTISLNNLPSTRFLIDVLPGNGFSEAMDYNLTLDVPAILADVYDAVTPNDTFATAKYLGIATGYQFVELTTHTQADRDFFRFTLPAKASEEHYFAIESEYFPTTDLGLALYDDAGTLLDIDIGATARQEVSLANLPAGNYRIEVFGDGGQAVTNPHYVLSSWTPRSVQADSFEGNDTFAAAQDLGLVQGVKRLGADRDQPTGADFLSVHSATDQDIFKFTTSAKGTSADFVQIDFDHTAGDLNLLLYSGQTNPFLVGSATGSGNSERLSLEGLPAGTYFAKVVGAAGAVNPSYSLVLRGPGGTAAADQYDDVFPNDNRNQATLLGPIHGVRLLKAPDVALSIDNGDEDYFEFELLEQAAPGHFVTTFFQQSLGDLDLELYNGNGDLLGSSRSSSDSEFISLAGFAAGTYYVRVFGLNGATNPQYSLAINGAGPDRYDEVDPNNTAAQATNLRIVGGQFQEIGLNIHNTADQDWFKFETTATAGAGQHVALDFEHLRGDVDLYLYNAAGTVLMGSSHSLTNHEEIDLTDVLLPGGGRGPLPPGTYTLQVKALGGATNPLYNLTIVAPTSGGADQYDRGGNSNNTRATAVDLRTFAGQDGTPGGLVIVGDAESPLSIQPTGDEDWFRINITGQETAGDFALISLDHTLGDLDVELYLGNDPTPLRRAVGVSNQHIIDLSGLAASDSYYLRVFGFGGATNPSYTLLVNTPETVTGDWLEARQGGPTDNNDRSRATDLGTLDRPLERTELSIHNAADEDWFRFQTTVAGQTGHTASIAFDHLQGDLELELYDQNGVLLERTETVNNNETITLDGRAAGTYYLRVVGRTIGNTRARNPNYTLTIDPPGNTTGDYAEPNDSVAAAYDLRQVQGTRAFEAFSIHAAGNEDWFKFNTSSTAVDGNAVTITFDPRLGDLDLFLYNVAGTQLLGQSQTAQGTESIDLDGLAAGTYLVRVIGHQDSTHPRYFLSIAAPNAAAPPDFAEENDTANDAADLQRVEGVATLSGLSIDQAGDQDWYVFETVAAGVDGHRVEITFVHAEGDLSLALFAADGTTLLEQSQGSGNREVVSLAGRAAGTYRVRVTGATTSPAYSLTVVAPQALTKDYAEGATDNDDRSRPYNLRTIEGTLVVGGLSLHTGSDQDWYRFDLSRTTAPGQTVRIDFNHAEGNLKLELFRGNEPSALASSDGTGDFEEIALLEANGTPLTAGTYLVRVTGAANPNYTLTVSAAATVLADRYEPNDTLATAYDFRALAQLAKSASSSRFFDFGFGGGFGFDPFGGFGGGFGGFDPFGGFGGFGGGFGGFDANPFGGFGGGFNSFDPFGGFDANPFGGFGGGFNSFDPFGGFGGGFDPFGGFGSLSHPGFDVFGGLGGFDSFSGGFNGGFGAFDAGLNLFGNGFAGLDVPFGPGLGVGNLVAMEFGFTSQFNNFAALGAINLAQQIPNVPGALEAVGFGGPFLVNALNGALNANGGLIGNIQANNAVSQFNSIFRSQSSVATISGLSVEAGDPDYYRFELTQPGLEGQFVSIGFDHNLGDLRLSLLAWTGNPIDPAVTLELSDGQGDAERISLAGLPVGVYYLLVEGTDAGTSNPDYSLTLSSAAEAPPTGDLAEDNDTPATAHDLRTIEGPQVLSDLSIHEADDQDWFRFTIAAPTTAADFVRIDFNQDEGDLDLALFRDGQATPFAVSSSTRDSEEIMLVSETGAPLPAGTYLVRVLGYSGATNPGYTLRISAPDDTIAPDSLEPNDTAARAVNLNDLDRSVLSGLTLHAGDQDFFQFTVGAGQTLNLSHNISVEFDPSRGNLSLALLDSTGNTVLRTPTPNNTGNRNIPLEGLTAGTYQVRVTGATASTANRYTLFVDAPLEANTSDDWTVLVYMTASDLASFAFEDINEMELAAASLPHSVNIVVLYDQSATHQQFATGGGTQAAWGTTGRAVIRPDTDEDIIATTFELVSERNTGNPASLVEFINWAKTAAPATNYALVMWDHGQGVGGFNFDNADGAASDAMTAAELASAIQQVPGFHLDILAFDSCNMAMTELADRFAPLADVIVASEENIPGTGYAYDTFFGALAFDPDLVGAEALASGFVTNYENEYRGNAEGADTLSALRSSALAGLTSALQTFTTAALAGSVTTAEFDVLRDARDSAASFLGHSEHRDLGQFMRFIADATSLPTSIRTAAQGVLDALASALVARSSDQRQTSGLSIVLPAHGESVDADYTTQFAGFFTATGWGTFLQQFVSGPTARAASLDPDFAEANEQPQRAYDLRTLTGPNNSTSDLSLHNRVDRDYFRFTTLATGSASDQVTVSRDNATGSWRLSLQDAQGTELATQTGSGLALTISLNGRTAGTYLVRIDATDGSLVPRYSLKIDAPAAAPTGDWAGDNSTAAKAFNLGVIGSDSQFSGLVVESGQTDWFEFKTPRNVQGGTTRGQLQVISTTGQPLSVTVQKDLGVALTGTPGSAVTIPLDTGTAFAYRFSVAGAANGSYKLLFLPNDEPAPLLKATNDTFAVARGKLLTVPVASGLLSNDSTTVTGTGGISAVLVAKPTRGTLKLQSDGSFTYRPGANYKGVDSFRYKLRDATGAESVFATVNLLPSVEFSVASTSGSERLTTVSLVVTLSAASSRRVTVAYTITGSATATVDYRLAAGTVVFVPGQTSKIITLRIVDDKVKESSENVQLTLSSPVNALLGVKKVRTYTIVDND